MPCARILHARHSRKSASAASVGVCTNSTYPRIHVSTYTYPHFHVSTYPRIHVSTYPRIHVSSTYPRIHVLTCIANAPHNAVCHPADRECAPTAHERAVLPPGAQRDRCWRQLQSGDATPRARTILEFNSALFLRKVSTREHSYYRGICTRHRWPSISEEKTFPPTRCCQPHLPTARASRPGRRPQPQA